MTTDTHPDIPFGYTYDDNGNELTYRNSTGHWAEYTRDGHGNELTYRGRDDCWYEYTRDTNGNVLTFENSTGRSYEYTRDTDGRELTYKDSDGRSWAAVAHDKEYTLSYEPATNMYRAGCRKFTRAEALAHWGNPREDNTKRAALFHAAITNNKESE